MNSRRIFVIDDDADMRDGLHAFLSTKFEVQCFASAEVFLESAEIIGPSDCILLDLRMPDLDGLGLQSALNKIGSVAPIIFMSGDANKADVIAAWRGGAVDFVLKPFSAEEIRTSIESAFERHSLAGHTGNLEITKNIDFPITRREAQVLLLLGQGFRQHDVAKKLNITLRTVKMYRAFLKDKLNLNSAVELARFYDQHKRALEDKVQGTHR